MLIALFFIFILSVILAVRSMSDFQIPEEVKRIISSKKAKGTIVFFKNKITHFHSS